MIYSVGKAHDRNFVCFVSGRFAHDGIIPLSDEEREIVSKLPLGGEVVECIWEFSDSDVPDMIGFSDYFEEPKFGNTGNKAHEILSYYLERVGPLEEV